MSKLKIALLLGGISGEREVSLKTGSIIYDALDKNKYEITKYDPKTDIKKLVDDIEKKKIDLVFPALHGPYGEDGRLQGMLDMLNVPYVFSNCLASALAMHKVKTKIIAEAAMIDTIAYAVINKDEKFNLDIIKKEIGLPLVIKPVELGSSVGMSIAKDDNELTEAIKLGFKHDKSLMLEQFIQGRELTVAVMGKEGRGQALPVIEIKPMISEWFDFKAKYEVGGSEEVCPAKIPGVARDEIQDLAERAFNAIGCKDLARADFIWLEKENKFYFLEINTIPGMTATSLAPQAAKAAGMEFPEFLDKIIG